MTEQDILDLVERTRKIDFHAKTRSLYGDANSIETCRVCRIVYALAAECLKHVKPDPTVLEKPE